MRGGRRPKRVSWAANEKLRQVKPYRKEDSPSEVGRDAQPARYRKEDSPPEVGRDAQLARIPLIPWKCPPLVKLDRLWQVAYGEGSIDVEVQRRRESRLLEEVYPRDSAIPPNPTVSPGAADPYDDSKTPLIRLEPIEEDPPSDAPENPALLNDATNGNPTLMICYEPAFTSGSDPAASASGSNPKPAAFASGGNPKPAAFASGGNPNPAAFASGGNPNPAAFASGGNPNPAAIASGGTNAIASGGNSNAIASGGNSNAIASGGNPNAIASGGNPNAIASGGNSTASAGGSPTAFASGSNLTLLKGNGGAESSIYPQPPPMDTNNHGEKTLEQRNHGEGGSVQKNYREADRPQRVCVFFNTPMGCKRGVNCPNRHGSSKTGRRPPYKRMKTSKD